MKRKRYPGTLVRRGNSFRLHLCVGGKRHYFTVPTTDRSLAERFAVDKGAELSRQLDRTRRGLSAGVAVSALFELFETQELPPLAKGTQDAYRDSLKAIRFYFLGELGDPALERIHAKHISGFLAWRRVNRIDGPATVSNRTLQKDRAVLHRIFALAERLEYREGNPVARVPAPKADPREPVILSGEQYEKLLAECAERPTLELYVLVLGEAGLRCESEALRLRWSDVDLEGGFLWVSSAQKGHRTKSGRGRHVPMTPRLAAAMRKHFADLRFAAYDGDRPEWIFHHSRTRRQHTHGVRIGSLREAFRNAVKRAGLPAGIHQHDLRHRRVTTWLGEGRDVVHVKEAMGHSDLRTTMGYTHLAREHLKSLVKDLSPQSHSKAG